MLQGNITKIEENQQICYIAYWEPVPETNGARLLRLFGTVSEVTVPEYIEELPVHELGAYCFSDRRIMKLEQDQILQAQTGGFMELCGNAVTKITLPAQLKLIGNCGFYNCRKLEFISMASDTQKFGSDVFMNCKSLKQMLIRNDIYTASGARQILAQLTGKIQLTFQKNEEPPVSVYFPEYTEILDEIAPAHIFGRKIQGEGFRARQCFNHECIQLEDYDGIFTQAKKEEEPKHLIKMALYRLESKTELLPERQTEYENYILQHGRLAGNMLVQERNLKLLKMICVSHMISNIDFEEIIQQAVLEKWTEGTASMIGWKQEQMTENIVDRYSFD